MLQCDTEILGTQHEFNFFVVMKWKHFSKMQCCWKLPFIFRQNFKKPPKWISHVCAFFQPMVRPFGQMAPVGVAPIWMKLSQGLDCTMSFATGKDTLLMEGIHHGRQWLLVTLPHKKKLIACRFAVHDMRQSTDISRYLLPVLTHLHGTAPSMLCFLIQSSTLFKLVPSVERKILFDICAFGVEPLSLPQKQNFEASNESLKNSP